ncbi:MAG: DUF192 domain-containing protein [Candidatus Omnitrophica bacterium]|nr:DUF192 domain-containing protein [Candidatus Omnitrophota bacterium]
MTIRQAWGKQLIATCCLMLCVGCSIRPVKKVCGKNFCVTAEVCDTEKTRSRGLMFRKELADNRGMLFIFEKEAAYSFWMKNMRFPIDIIWLDKNKTIIDMHNDVLPCKDVCKNYIPAQPVLYVLEVGAFFIEHYGVVIGEELRF